MGVKWSIGRSWAVFITYVITVWKYTNTTLFPWHYQSFHHGTATINWYIVESGNTHDNAPPPTTVEQTNLICFMLDKRYSVITYFTRIATEAVGTGTSEAVYSIDTGPTIQACNCTAIINVWKPDQICIWLLRMKMIDCRKCKLTTYMKFMNALNSFELHCIYIMKRSPSSNFQQF